MGGNNAVHSNFSLSLTNKVPAGTLQMKYMRLLVNFVLDLSGIAIYFAHCVLEKLL